MAFTFGAEVGSGGNDAGGTSVNITTTANIPAGSLIVVFAGNEAGGASNVLVSSISDGHSNTYASAKDNGEGNGPSNGAIWYSVTGNAVPSSSTITVTWAASTSSLEASVCYFTPTGTVTLDKVGAGSSGTSTAGTTGATGTLTQADEVVVALIHADGGAGPTISGTTGTFTNLTARRSGSTSVSTALFPAYQIVSATTSLTYSGTLSASVNWTGTIVSFKEAGATFIAPQATITGRAIFRPLTRRTVPKPHLASAVLARGQPRPPAFVRFQALQRAHQLQRRRAPAPHLADPIVAPGGPVNLVVRVVPRLFTDIAVWRSADLQRRRAPDPHLAPPIVASATPTFVAPRPLIVSQALQRAAMLGRRRAPEPHTAAPITVSRFDNYNRPDGPGPGPNWTLNSGTASSITSNQWVCNGTTGSNYSYAYNNGSADNYALVQVAAYTSDSPSTGPFASVNCRQTGSTSSYDLDLDLQLGVWTLEKTVASVTSTLATGTLAAVPAAGFQIACRATGNVVEGWLRDVNGNTTLLTSVVDSGVATGNFGGLSYFQHTAAHITYDNFETGISSQFPWQQTPASTRQLQAVRQSHYARRLRVPEPHLAPAVVAPAVATFVAPAAVAVTDQSVQRAALSRRLRVPAPHTAEPLQALRSIIPLYVYPTGGGAGTDWATMDSCPPWAVIANPATGPGTTTDANYTTALTNARAVGIKTLGYVNTQYGTRPMGLNTDTASSNTVKGDINGWVALYPGEVDGIFFDLTPTDAGADVTFMQTASDYARSQIAGAFVMFNPGAYPLVRDYLDMADVNCVFEGDYIANAYLSYTVPSYASAYDPLIAPSKKAHLVYNVVNEINERMALRVAQQVANVGYFYAADTTGSWTNLATYWTGGGATECFDVPNSNWALPVVAPAVIVNEQALKRAPYLRRVPEPHTAAPIVSAATAAFVAPAATVVSQATKRMRPRSIFRPHLAAANLAPAPFAPAYVKSQALRRPYVERRARPAHLAPSIVGAPTAPFNPPPPYVVSQQSIRRALARRHPITAHVAPAVIDHGRPVPPLTELTRPALRRALLRREAPKPHTAPPNLAASPPVKPYVVPQALRRAADLQRRRSPDPHTAPPNLSPSPFKPTTFAGQALQRARTRRGPHPRPHLANPLTTAIVPLALSPKPRIISQARERMRHGRRQFRPHYARPLIPPPGSLQRGKGPVTFTLTTNPITFDLTKDPISFTITRNPVGFELTRDPIGFTVTTNPISFSVTS